MLFSRVILLQLSLSLTSGQKATFIKNSTLKKVSDYFYVYLSNVWTRDSD